MTQIRLLAVGDISLETNDRVDLFTDIQPVLNDKDILFGNLETTLSSRGTPAEKTTVLCACPGKASQLREAGFDVLSVANNHIMDRGPEGAVETLEALKRNGISAVGVSLPGLAQGHAIIERKGIKCGFAGYTEGSFRHRDHEIKVNRIERERILTDVEMLKSKCAVVVISVHWGLENVLYPSPDQIRLARELIDAGATLVLGHHPHVIQGVERWKGGLIAYSLGSFQFDCTHVGLISPNARESLVLSVILREGCVETFDIVPIRIKKDNTPCLAEGRHKEETLELVNHVSEPIKAGCVTKQWWLEQVAFYHLRGNMRAWVLRIRKYGAKHLLACVRWLVSPFTVRCYVGLARRQMKRLWKTVC
jgi:poly-gamma-glutamate synthesis protein (capsule biosynthesis protein)